MFERKQDDLEVNVELIDYQIFTYLPKLELKNIQLSSLYVSLSTNHHKDKKRIIISEVFAKRSLSTFPNQTRQRTLRTVAPKT
jgi:hypothetical protein